DIAEKNNAGYTQSTILEEVDMDRYRIKPGNSVKLIDFNPDDKGDWKDKKDEAKDRLLELNKELSDNQELLYAEHKHKILIVIQAMDTGGKDGTIRAVFEGVNPQGVRVANFKVPTLPELDHDYLWRVHSQVPGKGELVIFNRSHYEDVLVVRVHHLVPEEVWMRRYRHMVEFERLLAEEGTTILKFYLHIDLDTQKERLIERIDDPQKQWKFNPADLGERKLWGKYMDAYEEMLEKTSTEVAPWYVIPANSNWYRNLVVAQVVVDTLKGLDMQYPRPAENLAGYKATLLSE
ncbi:MAG: PPK2 family polyphosphate kinase, partial [Anaerolineaceae bacterium]